MLIPDKDEVADREWISLLLQARAMGVTVEEIRAFIRACKHVNDSNSVTV
ncbi:anti-repressor SinI family protein [Paenibacillus sacheonensis]|uniref:DNA-binding anti-repressor SinI n=1 Tax=Paenibacillus sacheonensis TaxID=742054 RepID=A0A7X4YX55_9BACL|nr:anti-repressor SinI family protein [Paenibacillus sacheonensis]NBC73209.1 DNA-binding anti-repressor SinI [Paenibacillus sacheonensis]